MAQLHELARPNKIFRDRTTGKTDKPCPKKVASKKDLVGKDQRGLRERSPAVDVRVMASGVEGAERSGGLHKRSAEDWGASCRAPGTESLSVLSTSVTKQTGDMVDSEARRLRTLGIWARTTMVYAPERESQPGRQS